MTTVSYRKLKIAAIFLLAVPVIAIGAGGADPLFQDEEVLIATITAPMSTLIRERPTEGYLSGEFSYEGADLRSHTLDVKIRTRGHFRHANCGFPPLRLNFKKAQSKNTLFDKQNILKLVVHCDRQQRHEQSVLREYLAYKILNAITDLSFRVRLLRITYVDTENVKQDQQRYAFLIEHKKRLAKRIGMQLITVDETTIDTIQASELNLTSVFEFFIGNTDFSPIAGPPDRDCCHNYVLFEKKSDLLMAIPYDFDQAGFINAPYARANPRFRLSSVRERLYRGRCVNNDYINSSVQTFQDRREAIYGLILNQEGLAKSSRRSLVRYVDKFYELISSPAKIQTQIVDQCI